MKYLIEISSNVLRKVKRLEYCLPSDYLKEFKDELMKHKKEMDCDISCVIDLSLKKDLDKSRKIIDSTYSLVSDSISKVEDINEKLNNKDDIKKYIQSEMNLLLEKISGLSEELYTDELTGAKNRRWLFRQYLKNESFFSEDGVIVFIDINDFKEINDTFGHVTGDRALMYLVSFLNSELKKLEINFNLIRFAGDEFIITFKNINKIRGGLVLNSCLKKLESQKLKPANLTGDKYFKISFSFGVSEYKKGDVFTDIIDKIDSDMYIMKKTRSEKRGE